MNHVLWEFFWKSSGRKCLSNDRLEHFDNFEENYYWNVRKRRLVPKRISRQYFLPLTFWSPISTFHKDYPGFRWRPFNRSSSRSSHEEGTRLKHPKESQDASSLIDHHRHHSFWTFDMCFETHTHTTCRTMGWNKTICPTRLKWRVFKVSAARARLNIFLLAHSIADQSKTCSLLNVLSVWFNLDHLHLFVDILSNHHWKQKTNKMKKKKMFSLCKSIDCNEQWILSWANDEHCLPSSSSILRCLQWFSTLWWMHELSLRSISRSMDENCFQFQMDKLFLGWEFCEKKSGRQRRRGSNRNLFSWESEIVPFKMKAFFLRF